MADFDVLDQVTPEVDQPAPDTQVAQALDPSARSYEDFIRSRPAIQTQTQNQPDPAIPPPDIQSPLPVKPAPGQAPSQTPTAAPPPQKQTSGADVLPAEYEKDEVARGFDENMQRYGAELREHNGEFRKIRTEEAFSYENHPEYANLMAAQERLKQLSPAQVKFYRPQVDAMRRRIYSQIDAKNREYNQNLRHQQVEMVKAQDREHENPLMAANVNTAVTGEISKYRQEIANDAAGSDFNKKREADYTSKVSPLATLKPDELNQVAHRIATLNGMHPREALLYALQIGTPTGYDEQTKQLQVGLNGRKGKAGQHYVVIGHDDVGHMLVQTADGRAMRLDLPSWQKLERARVQGYDASKRWHADEQAKFDKPDLLTRGMNYLGFGKP